MRCLLVTAAVCLLAGAGWVDTDRTWELNIPRQPVEEALAELAQHTGAQLLFPYDEVAERDANSLAGRYTLDRALELMLRGTGLAGDVTASGVITVALADSANGKGNDSMGRGNHKGILGGLATAVLSLFSASQAAGEEAAASRSTALEEIVVTARRVHESLQETPISVSALREEDIDALGLVELTDIGQWTPNLEMSGPAVFIRGVGQGDSLMTTDPGVAVYVDGVYIARQSGIPRSLMDVERVEVLRGPQGTLFGKNSLGGAINISTRIPAGEWEASVEGRAGERDLRQIDARVAFPITEALAGSLSVGSIQQDGFYENLATGEDFDDVDRQHARAKLSWQATDALSFLLAGDYEQIDQKPGGVTNTLVVPGTAPAFFAGGAIPLLADSTGTIQTQYHGLYNVTAGCTPATATSAPECFGPQYEQAPYTTEETDATPEEGENWGVSLTGELAIGDAVLKSITAYRQFDASYSTSYDGSPLPLAALDAFDDQSQISQELQLTGTALQGRLSYTGGLYYFEEEASNNTVVRFLRTVPPVYPLSGLDDGTGNPVMAGPGQPVLLPTQVLFTALNLDTVRDQRTTSLAAYAQLGYSLTEKLSVTLGGRINEDRKKFEFTQVDKTPPPAIPGAMDAASPVLRESWSSFTPRLGVEYQWTPDHLLYASYANGFKSGGFNARPTTEPPRFESYEPEELHTWELGAKTEWLDQRLRLNASVFYSDYEEIQLPTFFFVDGVYITETANAGDGTIKGLEADLAAMVHPRLMLSASVGVLDFEYGTVQDVVGPGTNTPPGEMLPFTSKYSWTLGADATLVEFAAGALELHVDYNRRSKLVFDTFNTASQDPYGLLGMRLKFASHDGRWSVYALGKNVTDERYSVNAFNFDLFGVGEQRMFAAPQEWSLGFDVNF